MLIEFKVGNFLSFADVQTLSMHATKYRSFSERVHKDTNGNILKFLTIYGANASGKSNIVAALGWFQSFVINGVKNASYPLYCKVKKEYKEEPSHFEIKILVDNKVFVYGFDIILNNASFTKEFLYEVLKNGNKKQVFERNIRESTYKIESYFPSDIRSRLKIYADDIKNDDSVLFLRLMNRNKEALYLSGGKINVFKNLFLWVKYKLDVNSPESTITNYLLLNDSKRLDLVLEKMKEFNDDIENFNITEVSAERVTSNIPRDILNNLQQELTEHRDQKISVGQDDLRALIQTPNNFIIIELNEENIFVYYTLQFKHKYSDELFSLEEESDGTIRLLNIIEVLLDNNKEKVYIIDEINRTLHPLLTTEFIKNFLELAKTQNTQLIVTTHESRLMDLKLLRKDEISFVNKTEYGFSELYSLDRYDVRFDKKVITEYFEGKYGAIPKIKPQQRL